jgi:hypothetical protein
MTSLNELLNAIITHPCGYESRIKYSTSRGRPVEAFFIGLPLAVADGRPRRVIGYTHQHIFLENSKRSWDDFSLLDHDWMDIGKGVPKLPPVGLKTN